jgi:hypothetical protein
MTSDTSASAVCMVLYYVYYVINNYITNYIRNHAARDM